MKNLKSLLGDLWNSKKGSYDESKHPFLQRAMDSIKKVYENYIHNIDKANSNLNLNLHLASRQVNQRLDKLYNKTL